jgi:rhodanese-related sulfurtransferase
MKNFKTITREELRMKMDRKDEFVLLETLPKEEFETGHLPGAKNLPIDDIESRASTVIPNKNTEVVVYCASFDCNASEKAAKKLTELGYTNVIDYSGGKADWKAAEKTALTT